MNNPHFLGTIKSNIINYAKDKIQSNYNFNSDEISEIDKYIEMEANNIVNNYSDKYLNDNFKEKMQKLLDE